ncbi:FIST signal transduction protein [Nitrincola sp. MINF-07-Sa-05]|uniref:FIST signal transduction protein n=1 Tax=Nitrincola salilacus TaxID=3400273 RepID=UPI003917F5C6
MRSHSCTTQVANSYRAGIDLGEQLRALAPEVVFLFCAVNYPDPENLLQGLYDALEDDSVILIGNSGDGYYEARMAADYGAVALGLNSEGRIRWQISARTGAAGAPADTTRSTLRELTATEQPSLMFISADFHADASEVEKVLFHECSAPVVGGLATDDNRIDTCMLFCNRKLIRDGIVMLAAYGAFPFSIHISNTLQPVGKPGKVDTAVGALLQQVDGIPAADFITRETGKPVLESDRGIVTLRVTNPDQPEQTRLRSIIPDARNAEGTLGLYGGIEPGRLVQVCVAHPDELIREVYQLASDSTLTDFVPKAALVVSCAGRKWLLGGQIHNEVKAMSDAYPQGLPMAGFPSSGEFGPMRQGSGYTCNMFHNMTYVLLLLGDDT